MSDHEETHEHEDEQQLENDIDKEINKFDILLGGDRRINSSKGLHRNGNREQTSGEDHRQIVRSCCTNRGDETRSRCVVLLRQTVEKGHQVQILSTTRRNRQARKCIKEQTRGIE